jgi:DNA polymerase elongation subunit (family B)
MSKTFYTNVVTYGNSVYYRGYRDGRQVFENPDFQPELFVPSRKQTRYRDLDGMYVEPVVPGSIKDYRNFIKQYDGVGGMRIMGDINLEIQYIGAETGSKDVEYDYNMLKVACIDIETTCEKGFPDVEDPQEKVIAITMSLGDKVYSFGLGDFVCDGVDCFVYTEERDLLATFIDFWNDSRPDIVTGWNVRFFDIPYLYARIVKLLGEKEAKRLSPWKITKEKVVHRRGTEQKVFDLYGIAVMDYYDLYQAFTYTNQESYRLDHIAYVELGERKMSYEEHGTIREFYKNDFQKFMEYNVKDVLLVDRLEKKLKLMELAVALAYAAKVNFMDVFSQVKMWDSIIYHYLKDHSIVVPPRAVTTKAEQYAGAYVKDPIVGMHDWIMSFDLNSLYPHLIMQYNVSPETKVNNMGNEMVTNLITPQLLLDEDSTAWEKVAMWKDEGLSVASNGVTFTRDFKGFLPAIMEKLYEERKVAKKNMIAAQQKAESDPDNQDVQYEITKFKNQQLVRKVQLNSAYGAVGNEYCRYYDVHLAEAITISGQFSIRWIEKHLNAYLNSVLKTEGEDYVVAIDTDSVYLRVGDLVKKFCPDKSEQEVVSFLSKTADEAFIPFIDLKYEKMAEMVGAFDQKMKMGREAIASKGIWTAKKRYILNVLDNEGVRYTEPKIKVTGIETTRSSTPEAVREFLKKSLRLILDTDEETVIDHIEEVKNHFLGLPPEDIAFPRGIKGLKKYGSPNMVYIKGTPIATKGALVYNAYLKRLNMVNKYRMIEENDKAKFVYLKLPNPSKERVITFPDILPKEMDLTEYIDYETQFEKSFLDPLKSILGAIGWNAERESNLESLFV